MKFWKSLSRHAAGWLLGSLLILGGVTAGKAYAAEYFYYTQSYAPYQLMVAPLSDPAHGSVIYTSETGSPYAVAVDEANRILYFSDPHSTVATIFKANLDGSDAAPVITGAHAQGLAVNPENGDLYYAEPNTGTVYKAARGATGGTVVYSSTGAPRAVAVDAAAGYLYIADYNLGLIIRSGLDGTSPQTFISGVHAAGLAVDEANGKLYYSVAYEPDFYVAKADLATGQGEEIIYTSATGSPKALSIHKQGGTLYFSDWHSSVAGIFTASLTETPNPSVMITGVNAYGLAVATDIPKITAVSPVEGPAAGGTAVTLTGTGFTGATGVSFGGIPGTGLKVVHDTEITVTAPPGSGTVDVRVEGPGGVSPAGSNSRFTYSQPAAAAPTASVTTNSGFIKKDAVITLSSESGATLYYTAAVNAEPDIPTTATPTFVAHGGSIATPGLTYGDVLNIKAIAVAAGKADSPVISFSYTVQSQTALALTNITVSDKEYDGKVDAPADFSGAALSGIIGSDTVVLAGTPMATYSDKDAGNAKTVTVSGYSLAGPDADYYTLNQSLTVTASIVKKPLAVGDISVAAKEYDGIPSARVESISIAGGIVGTDIVTVDVSQAVAVFAGGSAPGLGKTVEVSNIMLAGTDKGNYSIAATDSATSDIVPRPVTVSQIVIADKSYDGTRSATIAGASLTGRIGVEDVTVDYSQAVASFDNEAIGSGKSVTVTGLKLGGADSGNYRLDDGSFITSGNINGLGTVDTPTASIAGGTEVKSGTAVSLTTAGFPGALIHYAAGPAAASPGEMTGQIASGGTVTITGSPGDVVVLSVYGAQTGYSSSSAAHYSYTIRQVRTLTVSGANAASKEYDGSREASVTGGTLSGQIEPGDEVVLLTERATGQFADKQAGAGKTVAATGYSLTGADSMYYELVQPSLAADIRVREVAVSSALVADKVFDGGIKAVITGITLDRKVPGDEVEVDPASAAAEFTDAGVGSGKTVTITGLKLTGADAGNYRLTSSTASAQGAILPAGAVAVPQISPGTERILSGTPVTLSVATGGAEIYYTLDGGTPGRSSIRFTQPVQVTGNPGDSVTVKAIAVKQGMTDSSVMEKQYIIAAAGELQVTAKPGDRTVALSWPAVPEAVTYSVYGGPGNTYLGVGGPVTASVYGYQAGGLTNGVSYTFYITAVDEVSRIIQSARIEATPHTVAGKPTDVKAVAGNGSVTLSFTAPADNGGSPIETYIAVSSPGGITAESAGSPIVFTGLANGVSYTFTVKAYNAAGAGLESEVSNTVTPVAPSEEGGGSSGGGTEGESSGNGSSTGNGGAGPGAPAEPLPVDVQEGIAAVTLTIKAVSANSGGAASATVSHDQINNALNRALESAKTQGNGVKAAIIIQVEAGEGTAGVETRIPQTAIEQAISSGIAYLTFTTPLLSTAFDTEALRTIAAEATGDVHFHLSPSDSSGLSSEAQRLVGSRPVYDLQVISGDKTISRFGGGVTVSVPYTPKAGEITDAIVIYYLSGSGRPAVVAESRYIPGTGMIRFRTNHFSVYGVGYNPASFRDVSEHAWYAEAVDFIAAREITSGTGDGIFSPDAAMTRGSFLVMAMRAYGITPEEPSADNFADAGSTYYTGYLAAAKRLGIAQGVDSERFVPEREITRQEMFTLIRNVLETAHRLPENTNGLGSIWSSFADSGEIESWAKEAVAFMADSGLISGSGGRLRPADTATRSEMAQLLYNLLTR
ncbi:YDG domain-containing protein [Paenibacillus mesotrionivorans]|uniref:YDG domain-containing protein n=1 Tax=Paenibacillus mesotrionivorans TaxID=3160968 RepID=A0ACC7P8U6_9BACL